MSSAPLEEHPLRVVIVDDTADLRELLRFALVRGGMNVVGEAGDGLAGIELVKESAPDVVLLDLSMPVMDGLEALPRIRVLAPEARIIVLSGFGANQMAEKALTIGADGYLQKGASLGRILDHIRDIVDGRSINPVARPAEPQPLELVRPDGGAPSTRVPVQRAEAAPESPVWDALTLAPFGIVEIAAEPPYRVLRINPAAQELFADPVLAGMPLQQASVEIADTVAENRLLGDMDFEAAVAQKPVQVVVRHVGGSLLLYLRTTSDEVGVLRSAIATTAHEIRGPVAVLCAIAEAVTEDDLDPEQQHKLMKSVARQSRMLDGITADLLTAAQIQRGTLRMDAQDIDPAAVIAVLLGDQYADSIEMVVTDHRQVFADPLRLEQMVGNLLTNACKYGKPPIAVRIRPCVESPRNVCIDVVDHGPGVPAGFRAQLFREFSRASGTAAAGTGLGLHVVRTLALAQGGAISYAPGEGGGSVFTLTLPAATGR